MPETELGGLVHALEGTPLLGPAQMHELSARLRHEHPDPRHLARLVARSGPLSVARACDYVRQAALGLQHAHECGLVHRDVKPANLLVSKRPVQAGAAPPSRQESCLGRWGRVKVLDLGLALL